MFDNKNNISGELPEHIDLSLIHIFTLSMRQRTVTMLTLTAQDMLTMLRT